MSQKRRKTQPSLHIRLGKAYDKILSGVPIEKTKLTDSDKGMLKSYLNLNKSNLSAFQLSQSTGGMLSSCVCTELAHVRKAHRRRSLEENSYVYKNENKKK